MKNKRIFLDYASLTPIDPRVKEAMDPWLDARAANPSALYLEALDAKEAVDHARRSIADILSCQPKQIVFTSGGTESNNMALFGVIDAVRAKGITPHVIVAAIEHPSVLEACEEIKRRGGEVTIVPVSEEGIVSPQTIKEALKENTVLVSVMYANNEIGTVQPIRAIAKMIREWRMVRKTTLPYLHVDACQAALYCDLNVLSLGADLFTLDGIKMYGPRGIGLLYVRDGVEIRPILWGGGQEKGLRSGTEYVPGIVGLSWAMQIAEEKKESETNRLAALRDATIARILDAFPGARLNGSTTERLPNNINICFPGLDAEFAVVSLDVAGIAVSYSSSCRTLKEDSSSYVVEALGRPECMNSSLRITMGRETTQADLDALLIALRTVVK